MAVQPSSPAVLIPSTSESDLASYHLGSLHSLPDRVLEAEDERYHSVGSGLGSLARGVLDLASSLGSRQRLERRLTADTVILDGGEGDSLGGHRLPGAGGQDEDITVMPSQPTHLLSVLDRYAYAICSRLATKIDLSSGTR